MALPRMVRLTAIGVLGACALGFGVTVALGKLMGKVETGAALASFALLQARGAPSAAPAKQLGLAPSAPRMGKSVDAVHIPSAALTQGATAVQQPSARPPTFAPDGSEKSPGPNAVPRKFVKMLSVARFNRDALELCTDITLEADAPTAAAANWEPANLPQFAEAVSKEGILLRKSCAEQFADRSALASCVTALKPNERRPRVHLTERYYNTATLEASDSYLKGCLSLSGDWQAVSKQSPEYRQARQKATAPKPPRNTPTATLSSTIP